MERQINITTTHATVLSHVFGSSNLAKRNFLKAGAINQYIPFQANEKQPRNPFICHRRGKEGCTSDQRLIDNLGIAQALKLCELVRLHKQRKTIEPIDFPTVRVEARNSKKLKDIERRLISNGVVCSMSEVYHGKGDTILTIYREKGWNILQEAMNSQAKLQFQKSPLLEEIREGVFKFKKNKKEQQIHYQQRDNKYMSQGMMFDRPLSIFIRRAVETDSEEEQEMARKEVNHLSELMKEKARITEANGNQEKERQNGHGKEKGYNKKSGKKNVEKDKKKPIQPKTILNDDDFPSLS